MVRRGMFIFVLVVRGSQPDQESHGLRKMFLQIGLGVLSISLRAKVWDEIGWRQRAEKLFKVIDVILVCCIEEYTPNLEG